MQRFALAFVLVVAVPPLQASEDLSAYKIPDGFLLKIGAPLPSVELRGADNRTHRTSVLKGKPTVVSFFTSHCGPCIKEIPALNTFMAQNPDIQVVTISPDDLETSVSVRQE